MKTNRFIVILSVVVFILLIPLVAMQFNSGVDWDLADFIIMGAMLLVTGLGIDLVLRKVKSPGFKIIFCAVILFVFFLIWVELATGFLGRQLEKIVAFN